MKQSSFSGWLAAAVFAAALALASARAAAEIIVTEVVTDPQQDHSENRGGNGTPFDAVAGTGTISSVDEFVELYNAGPAAIDLRGFELSFADGSTSTYRFGASRSGVLRFTTGSDVQAWLPGAFLLLGNPPGRLNNSLDIALRDATGLVVAVLRVDDGNATSVLDEAVARAWEGCRPALTRLVRAAVTPLAPPPDGGPSGPCGPTLPGGAGPVPESGTVLLVSAVLLAFGTRRTVRRVVLRRPPATP